MLGRIIVSFYSTLLEISIWLILISSFAGGWYANGLSGAFMSLLAAFVFCVVFFGAFLVLLDIRQSVRTIEEKAKSTNPGSFWKTLARCSVSVEKWILEISRMAVLLLTQVATTKTNYWLDWVKFLNQENNRRLSRSHYTLLETSREMKTTNTKILAQYLNRSPATIRTQFQRIMAFLEVRSRYEALRKAEETGLISR